MKDQTDVVDFFANWSPCKNATRPFDNCRLLVDYNDMLGVLITISLLSISLVLYLFFSFMCCSASSGCMHCGRRSNQKKSKHSVKSQRSIVAARPSTVRAETTEDTTDASSVHVSARTNRPLAQSRR
ncbi:hypothetical protein M3Y94_00969100 [Aphelenchoides besseyi]|nr:hypothetical protein M3Y94_00969100 [Aphelenchoides besseyi]KAI6224636.1 hypothetical protein M3Y95_00773800 [Aphelenchoides besseyi]